MDTRGHRKNERKKETTNLPTLIFFGPVAKTKIGGGGG